MAILTEAVPFEWRGTTRMTPNLDRDNYSKISDSANSATFETQRRKNWSDLSPQPDSLTSPDRLDELANQTEKNSA